MITRFLDLSDCHLRPAVLVGEAKFCSKTVLLLLAMMLHSGRALGDSVPVPKSDQPVTPDIQLVGVCASPLDQHQWWDYEGQALADAPDLKAAKPGDKPLKSLEPNQISRHLVLTARVPPTASIQCKVEGQKFTLRLPEQADGQSWEALKKQAEDRGAPFQPDELSWVEYSIGIRLIRDKLDATADVDVSISDGPWETVAVTPRRPGDGNDVQFELGKLGADGVEAFLPETRQQDVRVVAEDKQGEIHFAAFNLVAKGGNGTALLVRTRFRIPVADIKAYRLQTRPYQRYELSDIPLYPNSISALERIRINGGTFWGDRDLLGDRQPSDAPSDLDWANALDDQLELIGEVPSVRRVNVGSDRISDRAAEVLSDDPKLTDVRLSGKHLTADSLRAFADSSVSTLEVLGPNLKSVPPAALRSIAAAPNLHKLRLWDTQLTDADAAALAEAADLQVLCARGDQLTDDGLRSIARISSLQELRLGMTRCTDAGFEHLVNLKDLRVIDVRSDQMTNAALQSLAKLSKLRSINLAGTPVNDRGLPALHSLENLRWLNLLDTNCTLGGGRKIYETISRDLRVPSPEPRGKEAVLKISVNDPDGAPVAEAQVYLFTSDSFTSRSNPVGNPGQAPIQLGQTVTNKEGSAEFRYNTDDTLDWLAVWAITPDGAPVATTIGNWQRKDDLSKTLTVNREGIRLKLLDPSGQPASNVRVVPLKIPRDVPPQLIDTRLSQTTDAKGQVTLPGIEPKEVERIAFFSDAFGNQSTGFIRGQLANDETVIQLRPTGAIEGRIRNLGSYDPAELKGVVYTRAYGGDHPDADLATQHSWANLEVTPDGQFRIEHLMEGYANYLDESESTQFRLQWDPTEIVTQQKAVVELQTIRPIKIQGSIRVQKSWEPANDLSVSIKSGYRSGQWAWYQTATTDDGGRFTAYVLPGTLDIDVTQYYENQYRSIDFWLWRGGRFGGYHQIDAETPSCHLEPIDLVKVVKKSGKLLDPEGQPVPNESVYGFPVPLDVDATNCVGTNSHKDGSFTMTYPVTHPPVAFRGNDRESSYTIKQQDPLILVKEKSEDE
ncbi:hypothetical protein FYK55_18530 [Roseiconus nitratireducens]|uniref:Leucine Rich repeats (2 copies) n=1 Tax=Roseiconus nitratireducens TaxID=2605748 RepID=A0A5M6D0U9_9BACT|nr:hypothetical protein [Roseiconus nitratireducens]KAA5540913.1 hypothetical protein FYK55_18530 [Roseiconus nitratireducens]